MIMFLTEEHLVLAHGVLRGNIARQNTWDHIFHLIFMHVPRRMISNNLSHNRKQIKVRMICHLHVIHVLMKNNHCCDVLLTWIVILNNKRARWFSNLIIFQTLTNKLIWLFTLRSYSRFNRILLGNSELEDKAQIECVLDVKHSYALCTCRYIIRIDLFI